MKQVRVFKLNKYLKKNLTITKKKYFKNIVKKRKLVKLSKNHFHLMKNYTFYEKQKEYDLKYYIKYKLNIKRIFKLYYPNVKDKILINYMEQSKKVSYFHNKSFLNQITRRLDSIVFSAGFVKTHKESKQLIKYGHILVNNKKVTSLNYLVKKYDIISINPKYINSMKYYLGKVYRNKIIGLNIYFIRDLVSFSIIFLGFKNFNKGRIKSYKKLLNKLNTLFMKIYN